MFYNEVDLNIQVQRAKSLKLEMKNTNLITGQKVNFLILMPPTAASGGTRRPSDSAFKQQKLKAWQPILTPKWVISCFTVVGAIFIPIGIAIMLASKNVNISVAYVTLFCVILHLLLSRF